MSLQDDSNHKVKQIPLSDRIELQYNDVSRRAASIARMIDRAPDGVVNIRIDKSTAEWSVKIEQLTSVQTMRLTQ